MTNLLFTLMVMTVMAFAAPAHAQDYLIDNVRFAYEDAGAPARSLTIKDGRITAIHKGASSASDGVRIDGKGGIITAALMNSATELGLIELHSIHDTVDSKGASSNLAASFDVQYAVNQNSALIAVAREEGVAWAATWPSGHGDLPFAGMGALLHLRSTGDIIDRPQAGLVVETGQQGGSSQSRSTNWIKLRQALNAASKTGDEPVSRALRGDLPLILRASRESDIRNAINVVKDFGLRAVIFGGEEAWRVAGELAEYKISVVLTAHAALPATYDSLGARGDNAAILQAAGVTIAFAMDSIFVSHNAGTALRASAGLAAREGLPKAAALAAITSNPAQIWGVSGRYGSVEIGKNADLVIWSGDPLEPSSLPLHVFIDGIPITAPSRQKLLSQKYHPSRRAGAH